MLPSIDVRASPTSQLSSVNPKQGASNGHDSLKASGSAPVMQQTASSSGNIQLYDNFLSKLEGSPNWPADKEAVRLTHACDPLECISYGTTENKPHCSRTLTDDTRTIHLHFSYARQRYAKSTHRCIQHLASRADRKFGYHKAGSS